MANQKHDLVEYPIQDNVRLESYWRDDAGGRGPAASLYVYDDEIMRFDCFGGDNGHCHFNLRQTRGRRWMYPEGTFQDHIQQSLFDLRTNLNFCLQTHQDERVQEVQIAAGKFKTGNPPNGSTLVSARRQIAAGHRIKMPAASGQRRLAELMLTPQLNQTGCFSPRARMKT